MVFKKYLIPALGLFYLGCTCQLSNKSLQTGDLLFCSYNTGELANAISNVTKTEQAKNYSHLAIIEVLGDEINVIHASLKQGVIKETIENFIAKDKAVKIDVYRLKKDYQQTIERAIKNANTKLGLPYNYNYLMDDSSYYCSQLVYEIFKTDSVFALEPMTFKNQETNEYNIGWINYYRDLNISIPEGEPGCNPNGMAISEKLIFIGNLN